jgi:hypothetical protein
MMPRELTGIKTGGVVLKVDGMRPGFDDVVSIPEKHPDCRIMTIGTEKNRLVLEIQTEIKSRETVGAISKTS